MSKPRSVIPLPGKPDITFERKAWKRGFSRVAGIDEAGRGALAGPVFASAVILPTTGDIVHLLEDVNDSKKLSPGKRTALEIEIKRYCLDFGIGSATNLEIDTKGIVQATKLAAMRALEELSSPADYLLLDYLKLEDEKIEQESLIKGDLRSLSIAAASILAKTARDRIMVAFDQEHPEYEFRRNKGYGTENHRKKIAKFGRCQVHRKTFRIRTEEDKIS